MHEGRNVWVDSSYSLAGFLIGATFIFLFWSPRAETRSLAPSITIGNAPVGIAVYPITDNVCVARPKNTSALGGAFSSAIVSMALGTSPRGAQALSSRAKCKFHEHTFRI